jgi:hypothetical protein
MPAAFGRCPACPDTPIHYVLKPHTSRIAARSSSVGPFNPENAPGYHGVFHDEHQADAWPIGPQSRVLVVSVNIRTTFCGRLSPSCGRRRPFDTARRVLYKWSQVTDDYGRAGDMSISSARRAGRRVGAMRWLADTIGVAACVALALAVATPAQATASATATIAPIGSGSYLVTVTNTGSEAINGFSVYPTGFAVTGVVPTPACQFQGGSVVTWIGCSLTVAPAASTQMCYIGHVRGESLPGAFLGGTESGSSYPPINPSPAVASCPLAGLTAGSGLAPEVSVMPASSNTPGLGGAPESSGTPATSGTGAHAWSHAQCKSTYNKWGRAHHHATRSQKKAEANKLHKTHLCPVSILK